MYGYGFDMKGLINEHTHRLNFAEEKISSIFAKILSLKFPLLNTNSVQELEWVKQAKAFNDSRTHELVNSLKWNASKFLDLIKETYVRLSRPVEALKHSVAEPVDEWYQQIQALKSSLPIYQESTEMNTEFFL